MRPSFYTRYEAGEHEAVWRELIALGDAARNEYYYPTVLSVVDAFIDRAIANLVLIRDCLMDFGYEFMFPEEVLQLRSNDSDSCIDELEATFGEIPIVMRRWYERIVSVNFAQSYEDCRSPSLCPRSGFQGIKGLGAGNGLYFQPIETCFSCLWEEKESVESVEPEYLSQDETRNWSPFLGIGGQASSCEQKGFWLPAKSVDRVFYNDGYREMSFGDELREVFRWGGFPGWRPLIDNPDFYHPFNYRPDFPTFLPQLQAGLLAL